MDPQSERESRPKTNRSTGQSFNCPAGSPMNPTKQWWNGIGNKFSFSHYFTTQKYSLFDNETDEISIGNQQQYGSTTFGPECSCIRQSQFGSSEPSEHCPQHNIQAHYQHRSSLNLMTSSYEPIADEHQQTNLDEDDSVAKPDPVAVLPVSTSLTHHSKGHQQQQLLNSGYYQHPRSESTTTTTFGATGAKAKTTLSSSSSCGKGQPNSISTEYCLFSAPSLTNFKTSVSNGGEHYSSSPLSYFSLKGKQPTRDRFKVAMAAMGVASLCLVLSFVVLLKVTSDVNAHSWQLSGTKSAIKGESGAIGSNNKLPAAQANKICQTEACRAAGKTLYESINFTADPCDDFFAYACGNWIDKHPIPDDRSKFSVFSVMDDTLSDQLRQMMEQQLPEERNSQNKSPVAKSVQFAIDLYRECMDRDAIEERGYEPVKQQLNKLLGTSWPILNPDEFEGRKVRETGSEFKETFVRFYSLSIAPVISFMVQPDSKQTTTKRISFDAPGFGLGRKEFADQNIYNSSIVSYRKFLQDTVSLLAGKNADPKLLQERSDEIFNFEAKLALASTPTENRRTADVWYNRMTFGEFKQLTDYRFDWTDLVRLYTSQLNVSYELTDDDLVIVEDIPYYKEMTKILEDTPNYVVYNYMGWQFTSEFAKYTGKELQNIAFEYVKSEEGVKEQPPMWKRCLGQVSQDMSWALSRLYVDNFVAKNTKQSATQLIKDVREAFGELLRTDSWLDETTRQRALDKLAAIQENVAWPEWLLVNDELDQYYGFTSKSWVSVQKGKYLESIIDINLFGMTKMYQELKQPINNTLEWPMNPTMINAAYAPTQNSITLPAAILRPPFFDAGRPVYMNYGGMGSVVGHEITHGFDDQGQQFDKSGNLVNWWTEETKKHFTNRSKCFIDQYGAIVDAETNKHLNGPNTVGENTADNGGLRQAYYAFRAFADKNKKMPLVPYMTRFTVEQLFFLSYANIWCGATRPQALRLSIDYDVHSPLRYRVNLPLSNFDQFRKAFNCPAGSRMSPAEKCIVW